MFAEDRFLELWPIRQNDEIKTSFEKLMLAIFIYKGKNNLGRCIFDKETLVHQ